MPRIEQYTRQVAPTQLNNTQANSTAFGGDTSGQQFQGRALQQLGSAMSEASGAITRVVEKRNNRIDTVNRMRDSDRFYQESFDEFNRTMTEEDLTNPVTVDKFNQTVREKATQYIQNYAGTEEGRIKLEAEILNTQGTFTRQIQQNAIGAQRKFVMNKAGGQINQLANEVRANPAMLGEIYKRADLLIQDISPALYPEDEMSLVDAAQSAITLSALQSYTDSGQYEDARDFINENPFVLDTLPDNQQRQILTQIKSGIEEQDREITKTRNTINALKTAALDLGVSVSPEKIFSAATGIQTAQSPAAKIEEFEKMTGSQATPAVIAKIAYGVDLPSGEKIDYNKKFTPSGDLTPIGIQEKVKAPFDTAAVAKVSQEKIQSAIGLFRKDGNKQALLSAMISFQKLLDDGAVVREGDIVLQREAQSLSDRISLFLKPGQVIGDTLVDEMEATALDFVNKALQSAKTQIDPYIKEGDALGYRRINTIPDEAYKAVFDGVIDLNNKEDKKTSKSKTISADEFLTQ